MSTRRSRVWFLGIAIACLLGAVWSRLHHQEPAPQPVATPTEVNEPAAELADDEPATPPNTPAADEPSLPRTEPSQPSAAVTPATESNPPGSAEFENTPRKRSAEPMRLHFAHTPETRAPGIGLSKAACAELHERQQRADSLSDRELLHLKIDCRGR